MARIPKDCLPLCANCKSFYKKEPRDSSGVCSLLPRQPVVVLDEVNWMYPVQQETDFCRMFDRKVN